MEKTAMAVAAMAFVCLLAVAVSWTGRATADEPTKQELGEFQQQQNRLALRGLKGVSVLVEGLVAEVERAGLTQRQIQTDVELRLRLAGIRVLTRAETIDGPGGPSLYVNVHALIRGNPPSWVYAVAVELLELVVLERTAPENLSFAPENLLLAATWHAPRGLGFGPLADTQMIRQSVTDMVDQFINDYLAANADATATQPSTNP